MQKVVMDKEVILKGMYTFYKESPIFPHTTRNEHSFSGFEEARMLVKKHRMKKALADFSTSKIHAYFK